MEIDRPLFHAMPTEIIFQKYQPQKDYKFPLILRNSDKVIVANSQYCACVCIIFSMCLTCLTYMHMYIFTYCMSSHVHYRVAVWMYTSYNIVILCNT